MNKLTTTSHDHNLALWTNRIRECRASGLTVSRWCEQNNIGLKNYYYWMRKIKRETFDALPAEQKENILSAINIATPVFSKINLSADSKTPSAASCAVPFS